MTTLNPQPTVAVNSGTICAGNKFVIKPNGASSYSVTGGNFTVSPANTTSYTVIGSGSNGCLSDAAISTVNVNTCTGLDDISNANKSQMVMIYPNPSAGMFTIESDEDANVTVIDLQGRLMESFKIKSGVNAAFAGELQKGVYFVEIAGSNKKQTFRVVKL